MEVHLGPPFVSIGVGCSGVPACGDWLMVWSAFSVLPGKVMQSVLFISVYCSVLGVLLPTACPLMSTAYQPTTFHVSLLLTRSFLDQRQMIDHD